MSATPSHQPPAVAASLMPVKALGNVLVLCAIAVVIFAAFVLVVLSGFVGRYLFVRIPRSIRGHELTQAELDERALQLSRELSAAALPEKLLADIEAFERRVAPPHGAPSFAVLFLGEISMLR